jgi:hypothetical protein
MTVLVQVKTKPQEVLRPDDWMPWLNVTDRAVLVSMVAAKFIRERGGILPEESPLNIYVHQHLPDQRKHPSGSPLEVTCTELVATRN